MLGVLLSASCQGDEFDASKYHEYLLWTPLMRSHLAMLYFGHTVAARFDSVTCVRVSDVAPILGAEWASLKIPVHDSVIGGCWAKKTINSTDSRSYDFSSTQISSFVPYESRRLVFRSNNLKTFNSWKTFSVKIKINLQSDPMSLCTSAINDSLS